MDVSHCCLESVNVALSYKLHDLLLGQSLLSRRYGTNILALFLELVKHLAPSPWESWEQLLLSERAVPLHNCQAFANQLHEACQIGVMLWGCSEARDRVDPRSVFCVWRDVELLSCWVDNDLVLLKSFHLDSDP